MADKNVESGGTSSKTEKTDKTDKTNAETLQLESVIESMVKKIALFGKFEDMSKENNKVVQQVYQAIRDMKFDAEDNYSVISRRSSRSHISRRSYRSNLSRCSRVSTTSSNRQRRQELEENAAVLKAKMRIAREKEKFDIKQIDWPYKKLKANYKRFKTKSRRLKSKLLLLMKDSRLERNSPKRKLELMSAQGSRVKKNHSEPLKRSLVVIMLPPVSVGTRRITLNRIGASWKLHLQPRGRSYNTSRESSGQYVES